MSVNDIGKTLPPKEIVPEPLRWLRFLPRWSLMTGLVTLTIPIAFLGGVGQQASDNALGSEYIELFQAIRSPSMFRVAWTIDAIVWLMLGGILIVLAGILRRHAPIRAVFTTVCGIAQTLGAFGSFLRLDGISNIAAHYSGAIPAQQAELLSSYLNLGRVINSSNHLALLLQGMGFLLVAWGVYSLRGFPRWLTAWLTLPGLLAIAQFGLYVTGGEYLFVLNVIGLIFGNIALNFAIAIALWRPSNSLILSVTGEN